MRKQYGCMGAPRRSRWRAGLLLLALMPSAGPLAAQAGPISKVIGPTPAAVSPMLRTELVQEHGPHLVDKARDHRWEGLAIGASVAGILGVVLADGLCTPDSGTDSCTGPVILTGVVGAVVGGVLGGLIGSAIPKDADAEASP